METSSQRLAGAAEEASHRSTEAVARQLHSLTGELDDVNAALRGAAEAATRQSTEALTALFEKLSQDLDAFVRAAHAIETSSRASLGSLTSTGDRLRGELSQVLEKLGQTGSALDRVVANASGRLGEIQVDLGDRVLDLQRSLGAISPRSANSIASPAPPARMASGSSGGWPAIRPRWAKSRANWRPTRRTWTPRSPAVRNSLRALIGDVGMRSEQFERTLREFSDSVERNFADAQARAREIAAELAVAAEGATSQTTGQFEAIRENAAREHERTERALREAYEQANAQLGQIMDQATERFRAAVAEAKDMAGEVQRELDATRGELKRGVFDLPRETSEAADAMRRVVGDQIKALKELAAVVAPRASTSPSPEEAPAAAASPAAPREPRPPATPVPRRAPVAACRTRRAAGVPEAPPVRRASVAPRRRRSRRARPPPPPAAPPRRTGARSAANRAGCRTCWPPPRAISKSRARRAAPRRPAGEGLDSIITDIARLVDDAAAAETWERWRQGETNAVSRRLYTPAGQQAFEDIRRRVRAEPAFREFGQPLCARSSSGCWPRSARTTATACSRARRCCRIPARST